jgi:hypothetical protein
MVVEGHRSIEIGQGNSQVLGHVSEDLLGEISVTVMESVENREKRCGFPRPISDDRFVCPYSHRGLQAGEEAAGHLGR